MKASFHKKLDDTALEHETDLVVVGRFVKMLMFVIILDWWFLWKLCPKRCFSYGSCSSSPVKDTPLDAGHKSCLEALLSGLLFTSPTNVTLRGFPQYKQLGNTVEQRSQLVTSCVLFESRTTENIWASTEKREISQSTWGSGLLGDLAAVVDTE